MDIIAPFNLFIEGRKMILETATLAKSGRVSSSTAAYLELLFCSFVSFSTKML